MCTNRPHIVFLLFGNVRIDALNISYVTKDPAAEQTDAYG